jgi:prevent-host-death family protein
LTGHYGKSYNPYVKESAWTASEFKAKCLRLLDEVAESGHSLVITKRGRPVARVTPAGQSHKPLRGSWKGRIKIKGDIVGFNAAGEWESSR